MFLMWACEVIMVCDKKWVVDCGVCALNAFLAFLCTHWFSLYMYYWHLVIPAGLDNVIPMVYPKVYEGVYDCPLLICLCTIMSHLTFSCISLCHTFSYTQDGTTPLYVACQNGHKQTVDVLLKNGANPNLAVSYIETIN